jgi:hypothetical protein
MRGTSIRTPPNVISQIIIKTRSQSDWRPESGRRHVMCVIVTPELRLCSTFYLVLFQELFSHHRLRVTQADFEVLVSTAYTRSRLPLDYSFYRKQQDLFPSSQFRITREAYYWWTLFHGLSLQNNESDTIANRSTVLCNTLRWQLTGVC